MGRQIAEIQRPDNRALDKGKGEGVMELIYLILGAVILAVALWLIIYSAKKTYDMVEEITE